ncbi:MAG: hypothetical protein CVU41_06340 [Chloroflexi bacterium HGW-Chloroflexi-3]|nr:MAG: hypothetical protein CVU41_06340 [Chloroflexi bacterium HGW-Chloroflexi-3]
MNPNTNDYSNILIIGDFLTFLVVILIGFANHNSQFDLLRVLANWLPLCLAWGMAAPMLGLWNKSQPTFLMNWWRVIWAAILSVPLAVVIRGFILNTPTIGIFVLVMMAFSILGLLIWRLIWQLFLRQKS